MDLDKFRAQWDDPEFRKSLFDEDQEPTSAVIERLERRVAQEKRWRRVRRFIPRAALAALLILSTRQVYFTDKGELPLQAVALILELLVVSGLNWVDKAREKYLDPKLWLNTREFLVDEYQRIGRNIYYDQWTSALLGAAILCLALYVGPYLSAGMRIIAWAVAAAAVLVQQIYDFRKISRRKLSRTGMFSEEDDLPEE